jgi:small subunit ribosomal protein S8
MTMSDPLGDMLTRIRNGQRARQAVVAAPASKHRANVLEVLKREGYIRGYSREQVRPGVAELKIELKYVDGEPVIREISRVSKPGRRIYSRLIDLPRV